MKKLSWFVCLSFPLFLSPGFAWAAQDAAAEFSEQPGVRQFSGRLIVRPLQEPERSSRAAARLAPWAIRHYPEVDEYVLRVPAGQSERQFAARLMATGDYQYAHPDWLVSPVNEPNDPKYPMQWHHEKMASELAWDLHTGSSSYVAAFVDTGVDLTHPDLAPHLVPGYNSVDKLAQAAGGDVTDINGHGTAVAGCIGAVGNNATGVAGVCWSVGLMPIRTSNLSSGNAYLSDLLDGARWAIDHGAKSASVSYTGVEEPAVATTGDYVHGRGGILLWAAGNSATNLSWFDWTNVVIVGATNSNDKKTSWSSYGTAVDLTAPGDFIVTTARGGGYASVSGTSFSTPLSNGACALIWSRNPQWSNDDVTDKLFASCDDLGAPGEDELYGHGRVNLARALDAPGAPPKLILSMSSPVAGQLATFYVRGATPGRTVYLYYSMSGLGATTIANLNVILDLQSPVEFASAPVDAQGTAQLSFQVPRGTRGLTAWLQCAELDQTSNLIFAWVN